MAKNESLLASLEKAYNEEKQKEINELHNAIVETINQYKPSLENVLFVLELVRFSLMEAKYKEILGVVKLSDKPPIKKIEKE